MYDQQLFLVNLGNIQFITWATDRERAKANAYSWIGGDPDLYFVTPLSNPGDRVKLDITLAI